MSHSKAEIEDFKCRAILALGTPNAHDRGLPIGGVETTPAEAAILEEILGAELKDYKRPGEEARCRVFEAFSDAQTEA